MIPVLMLIPVVVSAALGIVYLIAGDGLPRTKALGVVVFVVAVYLQFQTRHALIGLLLQCALALSLAVRRRLDSPS